MTTKTIEKATAIWASEEFRLKLLTPISELRNSSKQVGHTWPASFQVDEVAVPAADEVEADFERYLVELSASTGTPIGELREKEEAARKEIVHASPSRERLQSLSSTSTPPEKYLSGDESCPF